MECTPPPLSFIIALSGNILRNLLGVVLREIFRPEEHLFFLRRSGCDELRNLVETVSRWQQAESVEG